jgi:hypothetical protein
MKNEKALVTASLAVLIGFWLASRPNCEKGCRSVAEHLIEHGLEDFVAGLLA